MSAISFTSKAAADLVKAYSTPDVIAQRETTLRLLDLVPGEKVLDAGSGPGFLSEEMAARVGPEGEILGIDVSADLIEISSSRNPPPQLRYAQEDALSLSAKDGHFDTVVSTQVAEYIPDTAAMLAEFHRVLRPGGRAMIMTTDWDCVAWHNTEPARMQQMMQAWEGHCAHARLPRVLAARLRAAGFETPRVDTHTIVNLDFTRESYSFGLARLMRSHVIQSGIPEDTADAWFGDLTARAEAVEYYFATTRMIFTARKPS